MMDTSDLLNLPVYIEDITHNRLAMDTSSGFTRVTTVVRCEGTGHTGSGEDVIYDADEHEYLPEWHPELPLPFAGTVQSFSQLLDNVSLFPSSPDRAEYQNYRRWAFESAALDLALRQADTNLASGLDKTFNPVTFVVSTSLGEPPSTDRILSLLEQYPSLEFKLDPTPDWSDELIEQIAGMEVVRILDCKAAYHGTDFGYEPDADLYRRLLESFPTAIIEDPGLDEETLPLFEGHEHRIAWDAPMTSLESVRDRPLNAGWLNIKPSRFGRISTVLDVIEYCYENDITMYGGGQFELGVGRSQIQTLASVFYPDGPNDVAPRGFNQPTVIDGLETSPLVPPLSQVGFGY